MPYSGRINGLFKFLDRNHLDDFLGGSLYMNTLQYFEGREAAEASDSGDEVRGDSWEGVARVSQVASVQIKVDGVYVPIPGIDPQLPWRPNDGIPANIFCLYALAENWAPPIHEENFKFGDTFACLMNPGEFFRRLKAAERSCGCGISCDLVTYFPPTYEGEVGIFKKRSKFQYQSELRIALQPGPGKPHRLQIGDLSDIVVTGPLREINERLRIHPR